MSQQPEPRPVPAEWCERTVAYDRSVPVHGHFARAATRYADKVALRWSGGDMTYADLDARSARLACLLVDEGVRPGDLVPVAMHRSPEVIIAFLGILRAGAAFVPLDPTWPGLRLAGMLADIAPRLAVVDGDVPGWPEDIATLSLDSVGDTLEGWPGSPPDVACDPESPAYVMFTSGSTGRPKGVVVPHRAIVRLVIGNDFADLGSDQTWLQGAPLSFDASTLEIWAPLLNGGTCTLLDAEIPTIEELRRAIADLGVTSVFLTTALFNLVVDEDLPALAPLRQLITGGEVCSVPHLRRAFDALRATRLIHAYGPTENTTFTTCHTIRQQDFASAGSIPIGRPIANTRVYVLDEQDQPVGVGEPGELCAAGDGVAIGYLGRPEATNRAFVPDPRDAATGARMYRTGDLVRWDDDGRVQFVGRKDRQLKIRGHRIEPGEIEAHLNRCPGVRRSAVRAEETDAGRQLVAFVVADARGRTATAALRKQLAAHLPAQMLPSRFEWIDTLPIGDTGKLDRERLPAPSGESDQGARPVPDAWNGRTVPYDRSTPVHGHVERMAAAHPGRIAIRTGSEEITYAELDARSAQLARLLAEHGVGRGDFVPVAMCRSPDVIVALLATLRAGAAFAPLGPAYPAARLRTMLDDLAPRLAIVDDDIVRAGWLDDMTVLERRDWADVPRSPEQPPPRVKVDPDAPAYVMFTSGTSGRPKGVIVPHRGIVRLIVGADYAKFGPDETWLQAAPLAFDVSTIEIWGPLMTGGTCALLPQQVPVVHELRDAIRELGVTSLNLTTSLFNLVVDADVDALAPVRQLLVGGEALSPQHVRRAFEALPNTAIINVFGHTENTTFTTSHTVRREDVVSGESIPIGRPIANTRVIVVDHDGRPVGIGVPGEVCATGDGVALGYLKSPDLSSRVFVPDPTSPAARMYRTGDQAQWGDDGLLRFVGRMDRQQKIRGHRVEPQSVEIALLACSGVRQAAVEVHAVAGAKQLIAFVSGRRRTDLRCELSTRLPAYMMPSRIHWLDALPLGPRGKVDRATLRRRLERSTSMQTPLSPGDGTALSVVLNIWRELLGLEELGPNDDVLAAGADSLTTVRAAARIDEELGVRLSFTDLLAARTALNMAPLIEAPRDDTEDAEALPSGPPQLGVGELLVHLVSLSSPPAAYNEPFATTLRGELNELALHAALDDLVARHEALRTRIARREDSFVPVVQPRAPFPLATADLPWDESAVSARLVEESARPFDLASEMPARGLLLRHGPRHASLLLVFHHVVFDDWAMAILFRELGVLYAAHREGRLPELPAPGGQPSDIARTLALRLDKRRRAREITFWKSTLNGVDVRLALPRPTDDDLAVEGRQSQREIPVPIDDRTAEALEALAVECGVTPNAVALAGVGAALSRELGRKDVVLTTHLTLRDVLSATDIVGIALNAVMIHMHLEPDLDHRGLIGQVAETSAAAFRHGLVPIADVLPALDIPRESARRPLQALVVHRPHTDVVIELDELQSSPLTTRTQIPKADLLVWLDRADVGYDSRIEYDGRNVSAAWAARLAGTLAAVYREMCEDASALAVPAGALAQLADDPVPASSSEPAATPVAPATATETVVLEVWRELLSSPDIGVLDDFFSRGGHSLLAVRMLARVEKATGVNLRARAVFEMPTVRGLATLIDERGTLPTGAASGALLLRDGGATAPLFCLPGVGGHAFQYRELVERMQTQRPLYALQLHDLDVSARCLESVDETAAAFVASIRSVCPHGPYALAGYSYGGMLAIEIARRLTDAGAAVQFVGLIDTYAPGVAFPAPRLRKVGAHLRSLASMGLGEASEYLSSRIRRRIAAAAFYLRERKTGTPEISESLATRIEETRVLCLRAIRNYEVRPIPTPVAVFRATRLTDWVDVNDPTGTCGWGPLAPAVTVVDLDCEHLELFREPHLSELAARLDEALASLGDA